MLGEQLTYSGHHAKREPVGEPLSNYFPKSLTKRHFECSNIIEKSKDRSGAKADSFSNIFRGFLRCGHCDSPVEYVNKAAKQASTLYLDQ
ncbi:hypothetical protein OH492_16305 [Vibrio chagasii]|nr:hypothetical protein [Vibrio chagasii]